MLSYKVVLLALASSALAAPISRSHLYRRQVPQEHSHEAILTSVRASLNLNNPDAIADPVFGLLGNGAAAGGAGNIADPNCLQQATADQAFTNAIDAGDVEGATDALIYRALERNSLTVGGKTDPCTTITAVNPEIAALSQHQDAAGEGAVAANKAIALELAVQIASIGGDPNRAIESGTFGPGELNDPTAAGLSCNDENDAAGCIFSRNLLVPDVTEEEIAAAVAAGGAGGGAEVDQGTNNGAAGDEAAAGGDASAAPPTATAPPATDANGEPCQATVTVTVTAGAADATAAPEAPAAGDAPPATEDPAAGGDAPATGGEAPAAGNLQTFTGALGGSAAPAVTAGGRGFQTNGADFLNIEAALGRSCDVQKNACANISNGAGQGAEFSVADCEAQANECRAAIGNAAAPAAPAEGEAPAAEEPAAEAPAAETPATEEPAADAPATEAPAAGGNLQTFTGALGGAAAPAVNAGGRGFVVTGSDDFLNVNAALGRSCDIQKNACANISNGAGQGAEFSVADCDAQGNECRAAIQ